MSEASRDDLEDVHREAGPRVQAELDQQVGADTATLQQQHGNDAAAATKQEAPAGAKEASAAAAATAATADATPEGDRGSLPSEVIAQFPQTDLSDVVVIRNSAAAQKKGTPGFATRDEIHVAPGADELAVLRHEAAHVVQMRKNQPGAPAGAEPDNERAARKAESGKPQPDADVGTAPADATRHYDGKGSDPASDMPDPVDFLGHSLSGASGTQILGFQQFNLFDIDKRSPVASFPVMAFVNFVSEVQLTMKAEFSVHSELRWSVVKNGNGKPVFQVSVTPILGGTVMGQAGFAAGAAIGAPFDLAGIKGTLGASGSVKGVYPHKSGKPFTAEVSTDGVVQKSGGTIGGGVLDAHAFLDFTAAVTIYAGLPDFIVRGWRWEAAKAWKLFSFPISMPPVNIPEVALPGPQPSAMADAKDQLAAGKPSAVSVPGTTLYPT